MDTLKQATESITKLGLVILVTLLCGVKIANDAK